jgi:hypothetical protein
VSEKLQAGATRIVATVWSLQLEKIYDVGLFVAAPAAGYDESKFRANVIRTSLAKLFAKDSQEFNWKGVPYSGRISKVEIDGTVAQGFNGSLGVLIKYRRLKVNGRAFQDAFVIQVAATARPRELHRSVAHWR